MDGGWVVFHELGLGLNTDVSDCRIFEIICSAIFFAVNALDYIVGTLFTYTATSSA
jgi:hypothetical protein